MDAATAEAWNAGPYSKCLRDAKAANDALTVSAADLWHRTFSDGSAFNDAEKWIDVGCVERHTRPCEYAAIANVFWTCRSAENAWAEWKRLRLADLTGIETPAPPVDAPARAVQLALPFAAAVA